jgi:hypothetical protein
MRKSRRIGETGKGSGFALVDTGERGAKTLTSRNSGMANRALGLEGCLARSGIAIRMGRVARH